MADRKQSIKFWRSIADNVCHVCHAPPNFQCLYKLKFLQQKFKFFSNDISQVIKLLHSTSLVKWKISAHDAHIKQQYSDIFLYIYFIFFKPKKWQQNKNRQVSYLISLTGWRTHVILMLFTDFSVRHSIS